MAKLFATPCVSSRSRIDLFASFLQGLAFVAGRDQRLAKRRNKDDATACQDHEDLNLDEVKGVANRKSVIRLEEVQREECA